MKILLTILFAFSLILFTGTAQAQPDEIMYGSDSVIYIAATRVGIDPVLLKATCYQESRLYPGVNRLESGYLTGTYRKNTRAKAVELWKWCNKTYGFSQSIETIFNQMAMSWDRPQIMGIKAYELGWRGLSFAGPNGLNNPDTVLYYSAKLIKNNLKRYNGNLEKAISAYNAGSYTERNRTHYINPVLKYMQRFKNDFKRFEKKSKPAASSSPQPPVINSYKLVP